MWSFIRRIALGKAADAIEQEGTALAQGKETPMTPQMKAWIEGAIWYFGAAIIADAANVFEGGAMLDQKSLYHAIGVGLIALSAYIRKNPNV